MAQTAATACASLSALGFASGLLAMSEESYKVAGGAELEGNKLGPGNTVELTYGLCVAWCFAVGLFGFFLVRLTPDVPDMTKRRPHRPPHPARGRRRSQ